jgi:hypothetical protein
MTKVEVYHFVKLARGGDSPTLRCHATLESIKQRGCEPILETRRIVDSSELDDNGLLKEPPVPSV